MPNRTTVKSNIVTKNVPSVTNAILTDMLNAEIADNIKFLEDVAVTQVSTVTNITVDFTGKDRIDLTRTGGPLNITVSGLGDGQQVYLLVTKTVGRQISFINVTDVTPVPLNINSLSVVLYEIVRKSSLYYARAYVNTITEATTAQKGVVEKATEVQRDSGVPDKYIDAELLQGITNGVKMQYQEIGTWNMNYSASGDRFKMVSYDPVPTAVIGYTGVIFNDNGSTTPIEGHIDPSEAFNSTIKGYVENTQNRIQLRSSSDYDNTFYDGSSNRGYLVIFYI